MSNQFPSRVEENLEKLAEIQAKNPSATHIYLRRVDKDNGVVDIPIAQAEFTIRNRPAWILVSSNKQMDDVVEALFRDVEPEEPVSAPISAQTEDVVVPPKPSEVKKKNVRNRGPAAGAQRSVQHLAAPAKQEA